MSTSKIAKIQVELGRNVVDFSEMTDSGDNKNYTVSGGTVFSGREGFTPVVRPNGVVTGRNMITPAIGNDEADVAAFTGYAKGVLKSVTAATGTITRPSTAGLAKINSVTMASDGSIVVVPGLSSSDLNFNDVRGSAGGPPYIPVFDTEVGQIRTTTSTAAVITDDEIFQVVGTHTERYDFPLWDTNNIGNGSGSDIAAQINAHVDFNSVLPDIHTGDLPKSVWIRYYQPIMSDLSRTVDFVPAEKSHSVTSQQIYGDTIASVAETLNAGTFTAMFSDGITDALVAEKNQILTIKFFSDRNQAPYVLSQGTIGLGRTYPVDNQNQATVTIAAETESADFAS